MTQQIYPKSQSNFIICIINYQTLGSELSDYYQKMAEEYRFKFLELEKDYIFLKNNHDYEL